MSIERAAFVVLAQFIARRGTKFGIERGIMQMQIRRMVVLSCDLAAI